MLDPYPKKNIPDPQHCLSESLLQKILVITVGHKRTTYLGNKEAALESSV